VSGSTVSSTVEGVHALAIGNFDGMHLGHAALFERLGPQGGGLVVEHYRASLTPGAYRAAFCDRPLFFYDFEKIRDLSPEDFIGRLRIDFPALRRIVVGEDFRFGAARQGDVRRLAELFDGETQVVEEVKVGGEGIHTRRIRAIVEKGDVATAAEWLGHLYTVWGEVVTGQGLGSQSLVPTINLKTGRFLLPAAGVYRTDTQIEGIWHPSVTFVGHRHTTDGAFAVETHLLDGFGGVTKPLTEVAVAWRSFIRPNRPFATLEALKAQIHKDIEVARER